MKLFCFICSKPALTEVLEMEPSKEPGDQKNREYFQVFQASEAALAAIVSFGKRNSNFL